MTFQAGAARRVLDRDPEFVREALTAIEETTPRRTVGELDSVLGLLRQDGEPNRADGTAYGPGLDALGGLLTHCGVPVAYEREGGPESPGTVKLYPVVGREAYRIVQEGLSNALRHGGGDAASPVRLLIAVRERERELEIVMENPLGERPAVARPGGGRGLAAAHRGAGRPARRPGRGGTVRRRLAAHRPAAADGAGAGDHRHRGGAAMSADPVRVVRRGRRADGAYGAAGDPGRRGGHRGRRGGDHRRGGRLRGAGAAAGRGAGWTGCRRSTASGPAGQILATLEDPPRIVVVTTFENDAYVYGALRYQREDRRGRGRREDRHRAERCGQQQHPVRLVHLVREGRRGGKEVAVAVIVEDSGSARSEVSGNGLAAPIAQKMMKAALEG
ncbi:hypothetical protein SBADM41S_01907 [Streptomyces badius]